MHPVTDPVPHHDDGPAGDLVEKIARTCLYEGYLLWPYRRSALKNARRWTFGGVYPRACAGALDEPSRMSTDVLFADAGGSAVRVRVRFLQVVDRQILRHEPGGPRPVDELTVDGERHLTWQEAREREVVLDGWRPGDTPVPRPAALEVPEGCEEEPLHDAAGSIIYPGFPADVLYEFRLLSLATQLLLWASIGLVFATISGRLLGVRTPSGQAPSITA